MLRLFNAVNAAKPRLRAKSRQVSHNRELRSVALMSLILMNLILSGQVDAGTLKEMQLKKNATKEVQFKKCRGATIFQIG